MEGKEKIKTPKEMTEYEFLSTIYGETELLGEVHSKMIVRSIAELLEQRFEVVNEDVATIKSDNSKINIALLEEVERLRKIEANCIKLISYGQKQVELNREAVDLIKSDELKTEESKVFQFRLAQGKFYGWRDSTKFLREALQNNKK